MELGAQDHKGFVIPPLSSEAVRTTPGTVISSRETRLVEPRFIKPYREPSPPFTGWGLGNHGTRELPSAFAPAGRRGVGAPIRTRRGSRGGCRPAPGSPSAGMGALSRPFGMGHPGLIQGVSVHPEVRPAPGHGFSRKAHDPFDGLAIGTGHHPDLVLPECHREGTCHGGLEEEFRGTQGRLRVGTSVCHGHSYPLGREP